MSRDPDRGKYTQRGYFASDYAKARERLAPLGGVLSPGTNDYEAFVYQADGLKLIFYPHRTTAGNYHTRVRPSGKFDRAKLREALFALAENTCTFQCPTEPEMHRAAVSAAVKRMNG